MRLIKTFALSGFVWLAVGSSASADVQLSIRDGHVSIVAKEATVRQILSEWAKIGQTKIVNVERVPGGPVTLELKNVSEEQALDVLLHTVSGYMAAPRAQAISNASRFDRIIVMPTSAAPRPATPQAGPGQSFPQPAGVQQPPYQPPQFVQPQPADDDDDQQPTPNVAIPNPRGPIFNTFPQPQVVNPQLQGVPAAIPGIVGTSQQFVPPQGVPAQGGGPALYPPPAAGQPVGGVAVPGMIVPTTPQPGQPGQPPIIRQ